MFILNQTHSNTINIDIIDQIVAVPPRMGEEEKRPRVIALIGSQEETLAIYSTMEDCRAAVEYVSFLINNKSSKIVMPKQEDMAIVHTAKIAADVKSTIKPNKIIGKSTDEIAKEIAMAIAKDFAKQFPGGTIK